MHDEVPIGTTAMHDDPEGRVQYRSAGAGYPVLLLHGWPQTHHAWRRVLPLLARDHLVIAPDLPGFGRSATPPDARKLAIARRLDRMMAALGHDRYAVVGHDMGGQVAWPLAADCRDRVSHLVFIESGLPGFGQERAMDVGSGGSWHFGFNMQVDLAAMLVDGREEAFLRHIFLRDRMGVRSAEAIDDADIARYAGAMRRPGVARAMFSYYAALSADAEDNRRLAEPRLACPVLAVSACQGHRGGAERVMRQVAVEVEALEIADCGHYPPEEQPAQLATAIAQFLRGTAAG